MAVTGITELVTKFFCSYLTSLTQKEVFKLLLTQDHSSCPNNNNAVTMKGMVFGKNLLQRLDIDGPKW